jgi:hypothetical protein
MIYEDALDYSVITHKTPGGDDVRVQSEAARSAAGYRVQRTEYSVQRMMLDESQWLTMLDAEAASRQ